jgi:hypothetical protein
MARPRIARLDAALRRDYANQARQGLCRRRLLRTQLPGASRSEADLQRRKSAPQSHFSAPDFGGFAKPSTIGLVAPEAVAGGPIAAVRDGDAIVIVIDVDARRLDVELAPDELARRLAAYTPPAPSYTTGVFAKYAALVSSAAEGAITRPPGG